MQHRCNLFMRCQNISFYSQYKPVNNDFEGYPAILPAETADTFSVVNLKKVARYLKKDHIIIDICYKIFALC